MPSRPLCHVEVLLSEKHNFVTEESFSCDYVVFNKTYPESTFVHEKKMSNLCFKRFLLDVKWLWMKTKSESVWRLRKSRQKWRHVDVFVFVRNKQQSWIFVINFRKYVCHLSSCVTTFAIFGECILTPRLIIIIIIENVLSSQCYI